jgi:hypothetical protein
MENTMKTLRLLALTAVGALLLASRVQAAEAPAKPVTLTGKIACAMCVLKQKEVASCTNVLVVAEGGKDVIYGLKENQVVRAWEMQACEHAVPVKVTGAVEQRAGKPTIVATRIEKS